MKTNRALRPYLPKVQASHITPKQIGSDRMTGEATSTKDAWGHTLAAATESTVHVLGMWSRSRGGQKQSAWLIHKTPVNIFHLEPMLK